MYQYFKQHKTNGTLGYEHHQQEVNGKKVHLGTTICLEETCDLSNVQLGYITILYLIISYYIIYYIIFKYRIYYTQFLGI